jgi:DNA-binding MarR family transcriptional regulator
MVKNNAPDSDNGDSIASLEFCLRLTRAHAALTRRFDGTLSSLHGLSFSDFLILHHLEGAAGRRLRRIDLAERMGMTASGVTRVLLPLEKLELVSRQPDARDARVGYAVLTDAGRRLHKHAMTAVDSIAREAMGMIPKNQTEAFVSFFAKLAGIHHSAI